MKRSTSPNRRLHLHDGHCLGNWTVGTTGMVWANMFFVFPALGLLPLDLLPHRTILLPGGRSDRYHGAMILGLVISVWLTLLVVGIALLTIWMESFLPDIMFKANVYSYRAMDIENFYVCLSLASLATTLGTVVAKKLLASLLLIPLYAAGFLICTYSVPIGPIVATGILSATG